MTFWLPPAAFALDAVLADPSRLPHPVQGIGFVAHTAEKLLRPVLPPILAGSAAALAVIGIVVGIALLICNLPGFLGVAGALWLAWSGLALEGLVRQASRALHTVSLVEGDAPGSGALAEARQAVQMLVSRDTQNMDAGALYRSLAESVSENFNDAFVAPWFWLCLTGPVGLWAYKAASTLDSMWGYTNERWRYFGRFAARLDDVLAYVPARIAAFFLWGGAWVAFGSAYLRQRGNSPETNTAKAQPPRWPGLAVVRAHARRSASPNAGWPMATAAWLFSGKNGGPTPYHGVMRDKPVMGPDDGAWTYRNTAALIRHVRFSGIICALASTLVLWGAACIRQGLLP